MENVYLCTSLCNHKRNIFFKSFLGHFSTAHTHTLSTYTFSESHHTHIPWNDIVQGWRNVMCIKGISNSVQVGTCKISSDSTATSSYVVVGWLLYFSAWRLSTISICALHSFEEFPLHLGFCPSRITGPT